VLECGLSSDGVRSLAKSTKEVQHLRLIRIETGVVLFWRGYLRDIFTSGPTKVINLGRVITLAELLGVFRKLSS
jgi:hypothetical protein